ncbi:MAG: hypothetical protein ACXVB9_02250 [Bdellovibrionota bacterium]
MDPITHFIVDHFVGSMAKIVMPIMIGAFFFGVIVRVLMFYYARAQNNFTLEFEKRVRANLELTAGDELMRPQSFQVFVGDMLELTFFECFELRHKKEGRRADQASSLADRLFLIREGMRRTIADTKRMIRYLRKDATPYSRLMEITKSVFDSNPYFNRMVGMLPVSLMHELTNILSGLFIVGGIFGTFLNISKGLPELGNIDLTHPEEAKQIMDMFLVSVSQSMVKSIVGIFLSVVMSLVNTFFAPDQIYYNAINRFAGILDTSWNETVSNDPAPHVEAPASISDAA